MFDSGPCDWLVLRLLLLLERSRNIMFCVTTRGNSESVCLLASLHLRVLAVKVQSSYATNSALLLLQVSLKVPTLPSACASLFTDAVLPFSASVDFLDDSKLSLTNKNLPNYGFVIVWAISAQNVCQQ